MNNFFTRIREIETFYNYNFNKGLTLDIVDSHKKNELSLLQMVLYHVQGIT